MNKPFYTTGQRSHLNRCYSFNVRANHCTSGPASEHAGLEIISPSLMNHGFKIRNQVHEINTNAVMFYNAREVHQDIFADGKADFKAIVVPIETQSNFFRDENIDPNEILFESPAPVNNAKIMSLFQEILFLREIPLNNEIDLDSLLTELLYEVFTSNKHTHSYYLHKATEKGIFPNRSTKIKRIIRESLDHDGFSLSWLSKEVGISKFHLLRIFKEENQQASPVQYRNLLRIENSAKALVKNRQDKIIDIAAVNGFRDISSFNRLFLKFKGKTPRAYRQSAE